jgi:hypothetical protein
MYLTLIVFHVLCILVCANYLSNYVTLQKIISIWLLFRIKKDSPRLLVPIILMVLSEYIVLYHTSKKNI